MPRKKNLYDPNSEIPFRLSRSKVDLYLNCPRCFYLDRRLGVSRPASFPFNLNSAVDHLLKVEFDSYREKGEPHPHMVKGGLDAIPFSHPELNTWRKTFTGVSCLHQPSNLELFGAVDDLWQNRADGKIFVVDYKATSKDGEVSLDAGWQIAYKRQMEFYQWLLRRNGLDVSDTGYFLYCNGRRDLEDFGDRLEFRVKLIAYEGNDGWVETAIDDINSCLRCDTVPDVANSCEYCRYISDSSKVAAGTTTANTNPHVPTRETHPSMELEGVREKLMVLRDRIRNTDWGENHIENWENILQRPIVDAMLEANVGSLEEWKSTPDIEVRYLKNQTIMDLQLERHWPKIQSALNGATTGVRE